MLDTRLPIKNLWRSILVQALDGRPSICFKALEMTNENFIVPENHSLHNLDIWNHPLWYHLFDYTENGNLALRVSAKDYAGAISNIESFDLPTLLRKSMAIAEDGGAVLRILNTPIEAQNYIQAANHGHAKNNLLKGLFGLDDQGKVGIRVNYESSIAQLVPEHLDSIPSIEKLSRYLLAPQQGNPQYPVLRWAVLESTGSNFISPATQMYDSLILARMLVSMDANGRYLLRVSAG